jgi:ribosome-associated protein
VSLRPIHITREVALTAGEVSMEYARASGPGGQHVNKTETRVTLRFRLSDSPSIPDELRQRLMARLRSRLTQSGEILVSCGRHRVRSQNIAEAWERLEALLQHAALVPRARKRTRPSRASKARRLEDKRRTSVKKQKRRSPSMTE